MSKKEKEIASISSEGRYKNCRGVISTPNPDETGYCSVGVATGKYKVGLLLLVAAVPETRKLYQISSDHIDQERSNNNLLNLRFATSAEQNNNQDRPSKHNTGATKKEEFVLENEIWKEFRNTGHFFSNLGRQRTAKNPNISFTPSSNEKYIQIKIGRSKPYVQRIIAELFLPPPENPFQTTVNHKNLDPKDNRACNLEWASRPEQIQHSYATNETRKSNAPQQSKPLLGKKIGNEEWQQFDSLSAAARKTECNPGSISMCVNGKCNIVNGWIFKLDIARMPTQLLPNEIWYPIYKSTLDLYSRITSGKEDQIILNDRKRKREE